MSSENISEANYSADNIQVLEGLEAVRKRPAMYIGDVGVRGLHHLAFEVVDNSIDEAMAGFCDRIEVTIHKDNSVSVRDNGRGIPVAIHAKEGVSALQVVMTTLHAGGKFDKNTYKVSGGLHGVGVSCVNALSNRLVAEVKRGGHLWRQEYERGKPLAPTEEIRPLEADEESGTFVHYWPDDSIFQVLEYRMDTLADRLRELAFLNKDVRISIRDLREDDPELNLEEFHYEGGIVEFVEFLDEARTPVNQEVIYI